MNKGRGGMALDHGPVPVRTAVQPSFAGQGRPGRMYFLHSKMRAFLMRKRQERQLSGAQTVKNIWEVSEGPFL